ncbi:hypothetical protein Zmor_011814 [Zophobas morio]|jgi:hypothetical protein|uniref:Uncharacterized protein n=1 Tax=Zophobas morio TaxID=2755281 RepID=A0AA38HJQ2_9CUCU|nr:hypothetical protein Zmor_011814 [Zophobas morio]
MFWKIQNSPKRSALKGSGKNTKTRKTLKPTGKGLHLPPKGKKHETWTFINGNEKNRGKRQNEERNQGNLGSSRGIVLGLQGKSKTLVVLLPIKLPATVSGKPTEKIILVKGCL